MRLALALAVFALLAAPADAARLGLDSTITSLVAGPDGGAWVTIDRGKQGAIGHAGADGLRVTPVTLAVHRAALGPDGQAWFGAGTDRILRADAAGHVTLVGRYDETLGDSLVTGPDGTVWALASRKLARITPAGAATFTPLPLSRCGPELRTELAAASDGSLWIADAACGRLLRVLPDGRVNTLTAPDVFIGTAQLAADGAGGVWFATSGERFAGRVDAALQTSYGDAFNDGALGVAIASDGSAWFTLGRCELARVAPDGKTTFLPAPLPALELAFGPGDVLWLASERRLVRTTIPELSAQGCDERSPTLTATPRPGRISLAKLRRDGLRMRADERALLNVSVWFSPRRRTETYRAGIHAVPWRFRLDARRLRQVERALADGRRPEITLLVETRDHDGNAGSQTLSWRIT